MLAFSGVALVVVGLVWWAPIPSDYIARLQTIQRYDELGEMSALSRPHFWAVAIRVARDNPLGIGLRNFETVYDAYDTSRGAYGERRSSHSTHFQILAETGYPGFAAYACLVVSSGLILLRIRRRTRRPENDPDANTLATASANGLLASMAAFLVGGTFLAQALNDLNWITFALIAALDRLPLAAEQEVPAPAVAQAAGAQAESAWAATGVR
jgi:O-antigen ligase